MTNLLCMYDNKVDSAALTASNEDAAFPVANVQHPFRAKVARITSSVAETLGPDLITNGDFASDLSNWDLTVGGGGGSITWSAGTLLFRQGGTSVGMYASQDIATISGRRYKITVTVATAGGASTRVAVGTAQNGDQLYLGEYGGARSITVYFVATSATTWITSVDANSPTLTSTWDNVVVKEVLSDYGSNLMTNGRFTSNTAGWAATNGTLASVVGGEDGKCLEITRTGGAFQFADATVAVTVGKVYKLRTYLKSGTSGNEAAYIGLHTADPWDCVNPTSSASWTGYEVIATAAAAAMTIRMMKNTATAGTMLFDSVTLYAVETGHIIFDFGSEQSIDSIALANYSWASAPGLLTVEFNSSDSWASPAAAEALTWAARPTANRNEACIVKKFASAHNYQYARLIWSYGPGGTPTDTDIGRVFLGSVWEPSGHYKADYQHDFRDDSYVSRTVGGQDHVDERAIYRLLSFTIPTNSQAQVDAIQTMINLVGIKKDLFVAFDYDNIPNEMTWYGKYIEIPGIGVNYPVFMLQFAFRESQ